MVNRRLFPEKSAKELLVQFRETGSEEPYEEIVRRYAAMVYGVCLRVTGDKHDAEDATQAVFLSLALQAKTSREITYVGPWLQKVAHRLALDVKKAKTRRKKREDKLADIALHNGNGHPSRFGDNGSANGFFGGKSHPNPADHPGTEELKAIMMEELNRLPAKYRMPLVLHYFGGLSREEMAEQLSCNPSTLGVRVHRGKTMLGKRLAKRGVAVSAVALAVLLEHVIRTTTVHPLIAASASVASVGSTGAGLFAASNGSSASIASASARVIAITRTALRSIVYAKMKVVLTIALIIITAAMTTGSVLAKYADLHVPMLDIRQWIRPLFKSVTPSLRVDATPAGGDVPLPDASATPPLQIKVDLDKLGLGNSRPGFENEGTAGAGSIAKPQAAEHPFAIAETAPVSAPVDSLLRTPIGAPVRLPSPVTPTLSLAIGSDSSGKKVAGKDPAADPDATKTLAASSGDFSLMGAGGGGGFGKADVYVMPANSTMHSNNMVIGDTGAAIFRQTSGTNQVASTLTLGKHKGASGTYDLSGGTLTSMSEIIGDDGDGAFIQASGVNIAQNSIIVGNSGHGSYTQSGDSNVFVINANPKSDPAQDPGGLHIGQNAGSSGLYAIADNATLSADPQVIGASGSGTLTQTGGTNTTGAVLLASSAGSQGTYDLDSGKLVIKPRPTNKPTAAISIGGAGKGTFNLGTADQSGEVYQVGDGSESVVVRGQPRGDGSLIGWGKIKLTGGLANNGQIVADGHGKLRTLDLSSFSWVTSTIENPRWGGTSGWFARRKGQLVLPSIAVKAGTGSYTWGEDEGDPMIDLVNSVRFTVDDAQKDGDVSIALMSPLRDDIPTLPKGHHFIGVWSFDGSELGGFDGVDLQVRYDDALARELNLSEQILKLWEYDSNKDQWIRINDSSFNRDMVDHLLSGHAGGDLSYFAVSAPEPASVTLLALGASAALLRRRRRR